MQQYNLHTAKTNLSLLVEKAAGGESFIIAKSGKPMVKVIPYSIQQPVIKRVGFLKNQIKIPADFDNMGSENIIEEFESNK